LEHGSAQKACSPFAPTRNYQRHYSCFTDHDQQRRESAAMSSQVRAPLNVEHFLSANVHPTR